MKILSKKQQSMINGLGPASGDSSTTGCTGDVDGDPNTTWDKYCLEGETEN